MSTYPTSHSDIDCVICGRWFHTTGDLIAHEEQSHEAEREEIARRFGYVHDPKTTSPAPVVPAAAERTVPVVPSFDGSASAGDVQCSCGQREAHSLTPGEWIDHQPDACRIMRPEVSP